MTHLKEQTLRRFFEGKATPQENRQIVAHFLRGCDSCASLAERVWRPRFSEQVYNKVFARVARRLGTDHLPALARVPASVW